MMDLYRQALLDHYHYPHNWGLAEKATFERKGVNQVCGDEISIQIDVGNGIITAARFEGQGCAISVAAASLVTDHITRKPVDEVVALSLGDVNELLGTSIAPARMKCALLALETAQKALAS